MDIQINLLKDQKDYNKLENAFRVSRILIMIIGVVCLVSLGVVFALKRQAQNSLNIAIDQRNALQTELNTLQDQEARLILIEEKMNGINNILIDVPDFSQQAETVIAFSPEASSSGSIDKISLQQGEAEVIFSFPGVLALSQFLATIESEQFLQNFEVIKINGLDVSNADNSLVVSMNVTF